MLFVCTVPSALTVDPNRLFAPLARTRQYKTVLSRPFRRCQQNSGQDKTVFLETGLRQDKSVSSCLQLCSHCRHGQDKTVLSCPCRRCEQVITVTVIRSFPWVLQVEATPGSLTSRGSDIKCVFAVSARYTTQCRLCQFVSHT